MPRIAPHRLSRSPSAVIGLLLLAGAVSGCTLATLDDPRPRFQLFLDRGGGLVPLGYSSEPARFDFGAVAPGAVAEAKFVLMNGGGEPGVVEAVVPVEGDVGTFSVPFAVGTRLEYSDHVDATVTFTAPASPGELRALFRIDMDGHPDRSLELELTARVPEVSCLGAQSVNFGAVAVGDVARRVVTLENPTDGPLTVRVAFAPGGNGGPALRVHAEGLEGDTLQLAPHATAELTIEFAPTHTGTVSSTLRIDQGIPGCQEAKLVLLAQAVTQVLSWSPAHVDCGWVPPGETSAKTLTLTNIGEVAVQVSSLRSQNISEFGVSGPTPGDSFVVPARGSAEVTVTCTPSVLGTRLTMVTFQTDLPAQPAGQVQVRVLGGGPELHVEPAALLDFGRVPLLTDAGQTPAGSGAWRTLRVMNVGTAPAIPDVQANLRLGTPDPVTGEAHPPFFMIEPLDANASANELEVIIPATYDPVKGLPAKAGENQVELQVVLRPGSAGAKRYKLTLYSNDFDEGALELTVTAEVVEATSCLFFVEPMQGVGFGIIAPPRHAEATVRLVNVGTQPDATCFVNGVRIAAGSDAAFALAPGQAESFELAPGESTLLRLRATANGSSRQVNGALEFFISSPAQPKQTVPLYATVGTECLVFAPDVLDFGTVKAGCGAVSQKVRMYNVCAQPMSVHGFSVFGTGFALGAVPSIPASGLTISPMQSPQEVTITFTPDEEGAFRGQLAVAGTGSGQNVTLLLQLEARVTATGEHVDTFELPVDPKTDVLFVLDDSSCSQGYFQSVVQNYAALMAPAIARNVDFHMGVVTADMILQSARGRLTSGPQHPERILTPATPNLLSKFSAKWTPTGMGSAIETCLGATTAALSPPLTNGDNAGFLREDATLRVLCLTDAQDQSPVPWTQHLDELWRVRGHARKTDVSFSAIAGFNPNPPAGCPYDTGPDDGRYAGMVASTFGFRDEICTSDWTKTVTDLGEHLFGPERRFFLGARRDPLLPVTVEIDGVTVPSHGAGGAAIWTLHAQLNGADVVEFAMGYAPQPGQTLKLRYATHCP